MPTCKKGSVQTEPRYYTVWSTCCQPEFGAYTGFVELSHPPETGRKGVRGSLVRLTEHGAAVLWDNRAAYWWAEQDSNLRRLAPTILQTASFSHSDIDPRRWCYRMRFIDSLPRGSKSLHFTMAQDANFRRASIRRHSSMHRTYAHGAEDRTRTRDPLFTKQLLYQLSYFGTPYGAQRLILLRSGHAFVNSEFASD